jgi:hypothetical protein
VSESSTSALRSVNDFAGQSWSAKIQRRFLHTRRTALPAIGTSLTETCERPCPTACTPQFGHPTRSFVVSTKRKTSPFSSVIERTTKPSIPSNQLAPPLRSVMSRVLSILGLQ